MAAKDRRKKDTDAVKAKILGSEMIYEGPVFGLRRDEVQEPSGVRTRREVITHPGSVVVLPVLPDGRIVMIRQYRHATRQYMWELVAGKRERRGSCWRKQDTARNDSKFFWIYFRRRDFWKSGCGFCWRKD